MSAVIHISRGLSGPGALPSAVAPALDSALASGHRIRHAANPTITAMAAAETAATLLLNPATFDAETPGKGAGGRRNGR
jgi:hypothetical protein